jgi:diacylglycerol kinase (ATP)
MTGRPLPILLNPAAGLGRAGRGRERLEAELKRQAISYALAVTENEDHLRRLVIELAAEGSALAIAGGDSTFFIAVNEILTAGRRPRLGLIGLGSSNDIPRAFGTETLERACAALKNGTPHPIDAGFISAPDSPTRYFLGQANVGLGAAVNAYVAGLAARGRRLARRQTLAGFLGIVRAYRKDEVPLALTIAGAGDPVRGGFNSVVFANTRYWATGRLIAPDARPDDGFLNACLIRSCSLRRLARIDTLAKRGEHARRPEVSLLRSKEFRIVSATPFTVQADGEIISADGRPVLYRSAAIGVRPAALDIFLPAEGGRKP